MSQTIETTELRRRVESIPKRRTEVNPQGMPDPSADLTLIDCDGPAGSLVLSYRTKPWMANIWGVVHGGVTANLVDTCMGIACAAQCGVITPTVTLTVNYARPVPLDAQVIVRIRTVRCGATSGQMTAEVCLPGQPETTLVAASGAYCTKPNGLGGGEPLWDEEGPAEG